MISAVFVDRPRLALVISIVITLAGLIALQVIPLAQFPEIVPPQVQVKGTYPGAGAEVVEATVAQPIESQVVGVDNMLYMKSTSGNDGSYSLTVSFAVGSDPDINTVNVQNRVIAETNCRTRSRGGVTVKKILGAAAVIDIYPSEKLYDLCFCQLRNDQYSRQHQADTRRRRCLPVRQPAIQHAHLGRDGPADQPRPYAQRYHQRIQVAEYPGRRGPHRRAADDRRPAVSA
jgi:hypothetical protein